MTTPPFCFIDERLIDRASIRRYLVTWLKPVETYSTITIMDDTWINLYGFMRIFYYHEVFQHEITGKYAFHVHKYILEDDMSTYSHFPNFGIYNTINDLIDGVVDIYADDWGLRI